MQLLIRRGRAETGGGGGGEVKRGNLSRSSVLGGVGGGNEE